MRLEDIETPLVAQINAGEKLYGPFRNGKEALEWRAKQPSDVVISFRPLRNPNVERTLNDFYQPLYMENEDREFGALTDEGSVSSNQEVSDEVLKR